MEAIIFNFGFITGIGVCYLLLHNVKLNHKAKVDELQRELDWRGREIGRLTRKPHLRVVK